MRSFITKMLLPISLICYFLFFIFLSPVFASTPPDLAHSSLSVSSAVPADGQTKVSVTVILKDSSGNPVAGDTVTLQNPYDSTASISPSSTQLDGTGKAVFTITSKSPGTYKLTVTDTTTNTPFNGLGTVYFNPTSSPYTCTNPVPGSTPQLTGAVATDSGKIILTWSKATDPVSNYAISYGLSSGQYQYGNTNVGGRDTTTFTVSSLSDSTKYYFVVKAINGCMPGANSNELSAITNKKEAGVVATSTPSSPISVATPSASPSPKVARAEAEKIATPTQEVTTIASLLPTFETKPLVKSESTGKIKLIIIGIVTILTILGAASYWYFKVKKRKQLEIFDKTHPLIPPQPQEKIGEKEP